MSNNTQTQTKKELSAPFIEKTKVEQELDLLRSKEPQFFQPPALEIARLESTVSWAILNYLHKEGYFFMNPPVLVRASGACENIDTLFEISVDGHVSWFKAGGRKQRAYLRQTGQLILEGLVKGLKKTCCFGQSLRAEPDIDERHLVDFTLAEIEFAGTFDELLNEIEAIFEAIRKAVVADRNPAQNFGLSAKAVKTLKNKPIKFERITYDEAIELLEKQGVRIKWGDDIKSKHEKLILQHLGGSKPFFLTHWPDPQWNHGEEIEVEKFFNMVPDPARPGRVQSVDAILPFGGEAVGGAARIWDINTLKLRLPNSKMYRRLQAKGGNGIRDFASYFGWMDHEGSIPHAGCGIGLSRVLQWLRQENDIRRSVTFAPNRETLY